MRRRAHTSTPRSDILFYVKVSTMSTRKMARDLKRLPAMKAALLLNKSEVSKAIQSRHRRGTDLPLQSINRVC